LRLGGLELDLGLGEVGLELELELELGKMKFRAGVKLETGGGYWLGLGRALGM
jgi:hypothetical protein